MDPDRIDEIEFQGGKAFRITWRGEELQMVWGSRREARQHLWMLNNPDAADFMIGGAIENTELRFADRFDYLKWHWVNRKNAA